MASVGYLIYAGVMPLIKMFFTILFGYILARKGLFPPAASRGASQVTMNVALPALIFSSIVPAFTPSNVSAIGPLALVAVIYVLIGFTFGILIREFCYVPRNFWQGLVVATGMSNWGNLPTAVVITVTAQAPFNSSTDPDLGVSFVAIFIMVYHLVFWVAGAAASLAWDYAPGVPQGEEAEVRLCWKQKPIGSWICRRILHQPVPPFGKPQPEEKTGTIIRSHDYAEKGKDLEKAMPSSAVEAPVASTSNNNKNDMIPENLDQDPDIQLARRTSHLSAATSFRSRRPSAGILPLPNLHSSAPPNAPPPSLADTSSSVESQLDRPSHSLSFVEKVKRVVKPLTTVVTPITLTLAISLPIALVPELKALFVDATASGGPDWTGPDGRPPLVFAIETAEFVGQITVPMALILLGASFARMKIPRPLSRLPIPAMILCSLAKMVLLPVIGVFMVQAMVRGGLIPKSSIVEVFVAMFLSGTPSAVNQLIVSALYSPDGDTDTLSMFLLVQYVFMFLSSAILTAVSLWIVEK